MIGILFNNQKSKAQENLEEENLNSKHRESFLPLPPKVLSFFKEYTTFFNPEDPLLYGLRGNPFRNKQMNYIIKRICEHLGWLKYSVGEEEASGSSENSSKKKEIKTDKYFTPHGLRYSIATIFHEMGVEDNALRLLLLHAQKNELGALERYLRRNTREIKQLRMAQILLETVLETALEMEDKFGVRMDLKAIAEQLPVAFENQMKNIHAVHIFKEQIVRFTMVNMEQMLTQSTYAPQNVYTMSPNREGFYPMEQESPMINNFYPYGNHDPRVNQGEEGPISVNPSPTQPIPSESYSTRMDPSLYFTRK